MGKVVNAKHQGSKWCRDEKRAALYERDGWACVYCGRGPRTSAAWKRGRGHGPDHVVLTLDHLTPRDQGGTNDESNLVTACDACNSSRQDRAWRDFAPGGAVERIEALVQEPIDRELGKAIIASLKGNAAVEGLR